MIDGEQLNQQKLFNAETAAVILQNLEKADIVIDEEKRKALEAKGYSNVELLIDKTSDDKRPIIKYDCREGLLTHYVYPDRVREFYILNDEKLKDEELRKKYIVEPMPESAKKKLGVKERRALNRELIYRLIKEKTRLRQEIKKQIKSLKEQERQEYEDELKAKQNEIKRQKLKELTEEFRNVSNIV